MKFRIATPADVPSMLAIYGPYVTETAYSFEYEVPSEENFAGRLFHIGASFPWLVCEDDGVILGYAYAAAAFERAAYMWDADLSVYLAPAAHRRGIGRAFYAILEDILAQQGYHNIYALVSGANEISTAFHRALGYELMSVMPKTGYKLGKWHDMLWFHKRLCPPDAPTGAPLPFVPAMLDAALGRAGL
jgi:phosphinothricin acetyltransferase